MFSFAAIISEQRFTCVKLEAYQALAPCNFLATLKSAGVSSGQFVRVYVWGLWKFSIPQKDENPDPARSGLSNWSGVSSTATGRKDYRRRLIAVATPFTIEHLSDRSFFSRCRYARPSLEDLKQCVIS